MMKFSNKLSLTIFITGLIALILLSFAIYKFNYDSVMVSQSKLTESIAIEIAEDIDNTLSEKIKTALTLANCNTIIQTLEENAASYANLPDERRKESIKQLNEKWKSTKDPADNFILEFTDNKAAQFLKKQQTLLKDEYGEIFLTNKFGALVASTSKLSTFAHGHKYWWLGSYNNGKGAVFFDDRGYDDSVGGYVLGLVVPVKKGNEIIGILKCNLNILGNITELITGAGNKSIGNSKLIRSGGRVVFEDGFEPLSTQIHHNIFEQLKNNDQGSIIITDSKEKYLVGFSQIKLTKGENGCGFGGTFESIDHKKGNKGESWYVLCYRQMSVAQAPIIESIKSTFLIGFAIIIILLLVSYLFGKKIATPLAVLNKGTQKIGKGYFEYRIDISQKDEFGNLGHSFNQMADKLQYTTTSIELLENEIAERKQAEDALRASEEKLRLIIDTSPIGICMVDPLGNFVTTNITYERMLGYSKEELRGLSFFDVTHPDNRPKNKQLFQDMFSLKTTTFSMEKKYICKDGTMIEVSLHATGIMDAKGNAIFGTAFAEDVTERKRSEIEREKLQAQLNQAQKMESIGTLAGGIAHDFNNILFPIVGHTEMLMEDIPENSPFRDSLNEIYTGALRARDLVQQILAFSRQEASELKLMKIQAIINEALKLIRSTIPTTISINQNIQPDCGAIKADPTQIHQIVMNLTTNAYHAMENDGGELKVVLKEVELGQQDLIHTDLTPGRYACLTVSDTGIGITKDVIDKIFVPFFTTKEKGKGTGMGLSVVHGIIKNMSGKIEVDSELGKGTEFHVYLPIAESVFKSEDSPIKEPIRGGTENILLVDDEEVIIKMEKMALERLGYHVTSRISSIEALEAFKNCSDEFDLVITDMAMPKMSGDKLAVELIKIRPDIPILLCTGFSEAMIEEKIKSLGIKSLLLKPIIIKDLAQKIREVLDET